jgi:hypothetical protein
MFFRPNLLILPEAVYDAIEYRPHLLDKLGEANLIKKVDEADGGILGGEYVQVAHDVTELVAAKDLVYSIKDVL